MTTGGWVLLVVALVLISVWGIGAIVVDRAEVARIEGRLPRCPYVDPAGHQCYLEPGHSWTCSTRTNRGTVKHWRGVNFVWNEDEGDYLLAPKAKGEK